MNSLRHVFWRGAMALSLSALGIGSGVGLREMPVQAAGDGPACDAAEKMRVLDATGSDHAGLWRAEGGPIEARRIEARRIEVDAARTIAAQLRAREPARRG